MSIKKIPFSRDNSPYSVWNAEEVKLLNQNIQDIANNQIAENLVQIDSTDIISSKKSFLNLFFTQGQTPSYSSVMSSLQNDITPLFGTGAKAIKGELASIYELGFSRHNVSGVQVNLAGKNPVYISPSILMNTISSNGIHIEASNVPLYAYDYQKLGVVPTIDGGNKSGTNVISSKPINVDIYPLTGTFSGNCPVVFLATPGTDVVSYIYLCYNEYKDYVCLYVLTEGQEASIPNTFTAFKKLGFIIQSGVSSYHTFTYSGGRYVFTTGITLTSNDLGSIGTLLSKYLKESCLIELLFYNNDVSTYTITYNGVTTYSFPRTSNSAILSGNSRMIIPMPYAAGAYPSVASPNVVFGLPTVILKSITIGGFI